MAKDQTLDSGMRAAELVGFSITAVVGFALNFMIILSIYLIRHPYICTKITLHLCVSNMFGSVFVIFLHGLGDYWLTQHNMCQAFLVFKSFWLNLVILLTSFLVYEGAFKVKHRLKKVHRGESIENENCLNLKFTLILLWVSSITLTLITFIFIKTTDSQVCLSYLHIRKRLVQFYFGFVITLPLILILLVHIHYKILVKRHRQSVGDSQQIPNSNRNKRLIQRDMHYAKSSFKTACMVILTWFPHVLYIFCMMDWFIDDIQFNEITYYILRFLQWISYSSCLFQPITIIITNYQIKIKMVATIKEFRDSLCGKKVGVKESGRVQIKRVIVPPLRLEQSPQNSAVDCIDDIYPAKDELSIQQNASRNSIAPPSPRAVTFHNSSSTVKSESDRFSSKYTYSSDVDEESNPGELYKEEKEKEEEIKNAEEYNAARFESDFHNPITINRNETEENSFTTLRSEQFQSDKRLKPNGKESKYVVTEDLLVPSFERSPLNISKMFDTFVSEV